MLLVDRGRCDLHKRTISTKQYDANRNVEHITVFEGDKAFRPAPRFPALVRRNRETAPPTMPEKPSIAPEATLTR